jgi:radical SAM protein with 4Fe4S-binding SPASM domain
MNKYLDYFKLLTFEKLCNFLEVESSMFLSAFLRKPVVRGVPYTISVEPTCLCNLRCPECPTGSGIIRRENTNLDLMLYQRLIDEIKTTTLHLFLYFQGEPFINRDIFDMIKYAADKKIFTIISTNGQFLDNEINKKIIKSGLNRLIISVDGTNQETFEKYRVGGDLKLILEGTKNLNALKKIDKKRTPEIVFQFLVFRHNEAQVSNIKKLGKISGANRTWIKSAQIIHPDRAQEALPLNPDYSRYFFDEEGRIKIKSGLKNQCRRLWRTCVITTDGHVLPCCFDKEGKYIMGDLQDTKLSEIWHSQKYFEFRTGILNNRREIEICTNCTEGLKVYI